MKIFGICLVKNEADIIAYSLNRHSEWADNIFVYDNGSTDGTWDIVNELAKTNPKIVPFKQEAKPFRDGLRAEVFNAYKHLANDGDWWCIRCDSDEFYIDSPKEFLRGVGFLYHVVLSMHFEYQLCEEDLIEKDFENLSVKEIVSSLKYYNKKVTSETRFIKHRYRLHWSESEGYPRNKGVIYKKKIRLKHFQYRSPKQIQNRIEIRRKARESGYKYFGKDMVNNWKDLIMKRNDCIRETPAMSFEYNQDPNKESLIRRILKLILHTTKILP
jgi:hypothetical protein